MGAVQPWLWSLEKNPESPASPQRGFWIRFDPSSWVQRIFGSTLLALLGFILFFFLVLCLSGCWEIRRLQESGCRSGIGVKIRSQRRLWVYLSSKLGLFKPDQFSALKAISGRGVWREISAGAGAVPVRGQPGCRGPKDTGNESGSAGRKVEEGGKVQLGTAERG